MKSKTNLQIVVFALFAAVFIALFLNMDANTSRDDPDTFWHIELGQEMIKQGKIIDTAIHSYSGESLQYVPHEAGFQLMAGWLYGLDGWRGVHILTLLSVFLLAWGLYRLMEISRRELDLPRMHPFLVYIALPFLMSFIYYIYFHIRPQMISAGLVVWFAVWLRRFALHADWPKAFALGMISIAIANVHTGVWPVIFVLFIMHIVDGIVMKKLDRYDLAAFVLVIAGGLANYGGWRSLTYFFTVRGSPFTKTISEWQPISFSSDYIAFPIVILFILCAMASFMKRPLRPFRLLLFVGMMYLGLSSYKQFLFLLLFLPYFMAGSVDRFPRLNLFRRPEPYVRPKVVLSLLAVSLLVNYAVQWFTEYEPSATKYPVDEMNYIQRSFGSKDRPKVMSSYGTSGYVLFRGGDDLADGRFDPFILDATKGVHQWTAIERSINGFQSAYLMDVIRADKPDFLIVPAPDPKDLPHSLKSVGLDEFRRNMRRPDFTGRFGEVWDLRGDEASWKAK
jgi:hypothetical protein